MSAVDVTPQEQTASSASGVMQLGGRAQQSHSPWMDAWRRLRRNRAALVGFVIIILNILAAIFAPQVAPHNYTDQNYLALNSAPSWIVDIFPKMKPLEEQPGGYVNVNDDYILGTDNLGRDLLSRIIYGARISLSVAFIGPFFSLLVGTIFGMVSGYVGGQVDNLMMRIVDIMYAFPTLLLVILLMAFFRASFNEGDQGTLAYKMNQLDAAFGGMFFIFIGIGLTSWMDTARLARAQVLSIREKEYIEAAVSIGSRNSTIIFRHILPNILGPIVVAESLAIPRYISFEAFLSFIGLGVNPPRPSWGAMISDGSNALISYPNQAIFPALALFFIMFAFNFMGDGLRDALDPHANKRV
ncbi:MAG TPA: ABC transporter permease [Aggregatilinea sp.]|uniref:ABC transporter permease n=1 Tax=Aggregatilinea sp. TaxID=2806333 RepID=UPI002D0FC1AB|nr:ABC transporter permease [Aggregatilinea sp.]HML21384.1 ABC transporter permease [Aggregatilinea sp.]